MPAPRFLFDLRDHTGAVKTFTFCANHLCWHQMEEHFGCSMWEWIERWMKAETLTDTHRLLYHLTESHRDRCGQLSIRGFLELLPDDPAEWDKLRNCLIDLMNKTFFAPSLTKTALMMASRALADLQQRESEWIGTNADETPPSSESPAENSGTSSAS